MSGQQERQAATDSGPVALVTTTAFPVLHLKIPIRIADLSSFAETTLVMIISHKALHRVTRLLRLIPVNSQLLLRMFLSAQGVTDANLLECKYASTYTKGGSTFPFPDFDVTEFPKSEEDLCTVMTFEESWFSKFHDAIASESVQALLEAMANVKIPHRPGIVLTRDDVFSYMAELVELRQNTSPVVRGKPEKEPVVKKVMQHWWKDLRQLDH